MAEHERGADRAYSLHKHRFCAAAAQSMAPGLPIDGLGAGTAAWAHSKKESKRLKEKDLEKVSVC